MAHIKTYCRVKPTNSQFKDYQISTNVLHIQVPENLRELSGGSNPRHRATINHDFKFTYIFNEQATQEEVSDKVSKEIIEGFLAGYNGTIFAYGQTGSGKTYTVEGSARRYKDRGLAPRAISMIYKSLESRQDEDVDVHVSYMEIYQEVGYDLLNPAARIGAVVTSFPKVSVVEGVRGACVIRNLSQHMAANEEVAQGLLIEGQANRQVAETPMNHRSSRSHAVFTIHLSIKKPNDDVITRSKLHVVDLAGSERVSKTGIMGQQLMEAKYINLSLHHLEGVIIALQQEASATNTRPQLPTPNFALYSSDVSMGRCQSAPCLRTQTGWMNSLRPTSASSANPLGQSSQHSRHIPYRNSLLTMVLRDSLGGNCQTAMIATITFEEENLGESLSTCRFSQRVACITNVFSKNQELDDKSLIRRLRKRVAELESELSMMREGLDLPAQSDSVGIKITDEEKLECARIMQNYLTGRINDPITAGITTPARFRECLRLLKKLILDHYAREGNDNNQSKVILDARSQKTITAPPQQTQSQFLPVSSSNSSGSKSSGLQVITATPPQKITSSDMSDAKWSEGDVKKVQNESEQPQNTRRPKSAHVQSRLARQQASDRAVFTEKPRPERSRSPLKPGTSQETRPQPAPRVTRDTYKSPFDQHREQEVRQLDQKVIKEQNTLKDDRTKLEIQQTKIKVTQLHLLKNDLSSKLAGTQEQLREQKLYILQLQNTQTDTDFIDQEKTVAKQLRKREIRVDRRLQLVAEQLDHLRAELATPVEPIAKPRPIRPKHKEHDTQPTAPLRPHTGSHNQPVTQNHSSTQGQPASNQGHLGGPQTQTSVPHASNATVLPQGGSIENRFPQYVKRDGKMNTRQVLDALKTQDKKQEKLRTDLEKEKVFTMSQEIQNKETATRQKLLEFREKLKQAKLGNFQFRKRDSSPEQSGSGGEQSKPPIPSRRSAFVELQPSPRLRHNITTAAMPSNTVQVEKSAHDQGPSNLSSSSNTSLTCLVPKDSDMGSQTASVTTLQGVDASVISNEAVRGSQTLSFLPASRVSSAGTRTSHKLADELSYLEKKRNISAMWGVENTTPNTAVNTPAVPLFVGGDISQISAGNISTAPLQDVGYEDTPRVDHLNNSMCRASSQGSFDIGRSVSETSICDAEIQKVFQQNGGQDSGLHSGSSSPFNHQESDFHQSPEHLMRQPIVKPQYSQPHRLVNQFMSENGKTKIDESPEKAFSQKKFDETLQRMLGADVQPTLNYSREHYNQFARPGRDRCKTAKVTSKPRPKPSMHGVKAHMQKPNGLGDSNGDKAKTFNPWGPEAKGMSVGERIAKFLEVTSKEPSTTQTDDYDDEEEMLVSDHLTGSSQSKVKIKALEDTEREEAYMSSMRAERLRVARIRKARSAAEVIQRSWRRYKHRRR